MNVRSLIALVAAAWCLASAFLIGDGQLAGTGDPVADAATAAVYLVGRVLLVGLGLVALAIVEWRSIGLSWKVTRD